MCFGMFCQDGEVVFIHSKQVFKTGPSTLILVSQSVENGQAIGDATRLRDNLTTKVGHEAAPGGQLTLKDDSDAKITNGPKMKEKKSSNQISLTLQKKPKI